jgi:molybdopterin-biosynthesis enzyme MoeA-like protein
MSQPANPTAGLLVIGDEILSGRTKDVNIGTTADFCTDLAIDLMEVRVVSDIEDDIVAAVRCAFGSLHLCVHHRRHRPDP